LSELGGIEHPFVQNFFQGVKHRLKHLE
jgi:hypothetical protein